jgi:hypothetical protein
MSSSGVIEGSTLPEETGFPLTTPICDLGGRLCGKTGEEPWCADRRYLHELHEEEVQEEQPDVCFSTPLMPNTENRFLT